MEQERLHFGPVGWLQTGFHEFESLEEFAIAWESTPFLVVAVRVAVGAVQHFEENEQT